METILTIMLTVCLLAAVVLVPILSVSIATLSLAVVLSSQPLPIKIPTVCAYATGIFFCLTGVDNSNLSHLGTGLTLIVFAAAPIVVSALRARI